VRRWGGGRSSISTAIVAVALVGASACSGHAKARRSAATTVSPSSSTTESSVVTAGPTSSAAGTCGVLPENGVPVRHFCGTARVSWVVGGRRGALDGGECQVGPDYLTVTAGALVLGQSPTLRRQHVYFALSVGRAPGSTTPGVRADGTYEGLVTLNDRGDAHSLSHAQIALSEARHAGTFSGHDEAGGLVSGTFHC
jgi:hypothetical protein